MAIELSLTDPSRAKPHLVTSTPQGPLSYSTWRNDLAQQNFIRGRTLEEMSAAERDEARRNAMSQRQIVQDGR